MSYELSMSYKLSMSYLPYTSYECHNPTRSVIVSIGSCSARWGLRPSVLSRSSVTV